MKTLNIIIILFIVNISGLFSKTGNAKKNTPELYKQFAQAENYLRHDNFMEALDIYRKLYEQDNSNYNLCYKLGECYLRLKKKERAVYFLQKASVFVTNIYDDGSLEERHAPLLTYMLLGEAYHQIGKFDEAINTYKKFKQMLKSARIKETEVIRETNRQIDMCYTAKKLVLRPVNAIIKNMGSTVNSQYADYAPVFTGDQCTMLFTTGRPTNVGGQTYDGGKYFEDVYISYKKDSVWSPAENIGVPINTVDNDGAVCISADGQEILIFKDDKGDGNIYSTTLQGTLWSVPKKLNSHINSKSWEPSAFIAANGRTLFFTSDRPGGYGGTDIYKSEKNSLGEWGKAVNLGPEINTIYDEDAPFLHPDGVSFYFTSNGHETMGGFDIFESSLLESGKWSEPVNIGYPINSPDDEAFYVLSPDKKTAYYTSVREEGFGEKDNYVITYTDVKNNSLELQKGLILDQNQLVAKNVKITVTDNHSHELEGIYYPNESTGKYLFILEPGKSHNITYEAAGFLFYSENRYVSRADDYNEIVKSIKLPPIAIGSNVVLNNIFFDFDKSTLRPNSKAELIRLYEFLFNHPDLSVEITGFVDAENADEYNINLSKERATAVVDYLVEKGIKKERLMADGCGDLLPFVEHKTNMSYSPRVRQLNQRLELKIIDIK
ncbi:MAG: ompA [Bacteroidota bacterium]|jgi:outer membrane protein OmpA-like peptidoglycan-associated protein|nr:ompA [Bacteroidota bacterium]